MAKMNSCYVRCIIRTIICAPQKLLFIYFIYLRHVCLSKLSYNFHRHKPAYHHSVSSCGPQNRFTITVNLYDNLF
jgi:hypothetical protein